MKWSFWNLMVGCAFAAMAASVGCTPSNKVPAGAPVLVNFVVVDPTGAAVDLTPTEAGTTPQVPALSTFYALFDRLLDPTTLETIDSDGGTITPNQGVAVIQWSGGSVASHILYVPNSDAKFTLIPALFGIPYANGPSITVSTTMDLGLPSDSAVTVGLDPGKVRSHDQATPFKVDDGVTSPVTFHTEPLTASIVVPVPEPSDAAAADDAGTDDASTGDGGTGASTPPPVDPAYVVHLSFNNFTADATAAQIRTTDMAGTPIDLGAVVARDDMDPTGWMVSPPSTGWPPGAAITITVGANAVDNFGIKLGAAASASFTVKP